MAIGMSAFVQAVCQGTYSTTTDTNLVEGSVCATISYAAQTFRKNNRKDPRLDQDGRTCFLLTEHWRVYRNQDGAKRKQKALPMIALQKMMELASTKWETATTWLLIGAIFFAMHSCEYLMTTSRKESKQTKILRLKNIQFIKNGRRVRHSNPGLERSDIVLITFEFQKNNRRDEQIHMFSTNDVF